MNYELLLKSRLPLLQGLHGCFRSEYLCSSISLKRRILYLIKCAILVVVLLANIIITLEHMFFRKTSSVRLSVELSSSGVFIIIYFQSTLQLSVTVWMSNRIASLDDTILHTLSRCEIQTIRNVKFKFLSVFTLAVSILQSGRQTTTEIKHFMQTPDYKQFTLFLGRSRIFTMVIISIVEVSRNFGFIFIFLWLVIVSSGLLDILDEFVEEIVMGSSFRIETHTNLAGDFIFPVVPLSLMMQTLSHQFAKSSRANPEDNRQLVNKWMALEKAYEKFTNISGIYLLLLIPSLVAILVLRLGHGLFLDDDRALSISRFVSAICVVLWLVVLIELGHLIRDRVDKNRIRLMQWMYLERMENDRVICLSAYNLLIQTLRFSSDLE
jgi:hypothetical protein